MKKIFIYLILVCCLSCSNNKNNNLSVFDFVTDKEIVFPIDNPQDGIPEFVMFDYDIIDGVETIIVPIQYNRLAFYNVKTGKEYHSIPLLKKNLETFDYINKDSIFLHYQANFIDTSFTKLETTNLQMVDYKGNAKICEFKISESDTVWNEDDLLPIPYVDSRLLFNNGKLFLATSKSENIVGTKDFFNENNPIVMSYNLKTNKVKVSKSLQYPYTKDSLIYNTRFPYFYSCFSADKKPVFRFFYSSELFEWDYEKDIVKSHSLKSKLIDSIFPLKSWNSSPDNLEAIYSDIHFDPYKEIYYSDLTIFPYPSIFPTYRALIIADKNFNYLGEVVNPKIGGRPIYTKDHIITYFCEQDSIRIVYKKLIKSNLNLCKYIDSIKNQINQTKSLIYSSYEIYLKFEYPILAYVGLTQKVKEKDYVLLTIYENGGCTPCEENIKKLISQNNKVFAKLPFYLILTGSKQAVLDGSYESFSNLNFVQDTAGIVQQLTYKEDKYSMLNPRLTVVRDNEIVLDTIYDAFHIESDLIPNLIENLGLKEKK